MGRFASILALGLSALAPGCHDRAPPMDDVRRIPDAEPLVLVAEAQVDAGRGARGASSDRSS
jgi:hypothetical protein